jgi:hypothetical protein
MLTRRTLFKAAVAIGTAAAFPMSIFSGRATAAVNSQNARKDSSERHNVLEVIAALEVREDIQGDLDIVELISLDMPFEEIESGADFLFGECPLCQSVLRVSQNELSFDLRDMLPRIALGERNSFENLCAFDLGEIEAICHFTRVNTPVDHSTWKWLGEQGVPVETVRRLQMGFISERQPHRTLRGELAAAAWDVPTLVSIGMLRQSIIQLTKGRIVIPIRDNHGRILAFSCAIPDIDPFHCFCSRWVADQMRVASPRRYNRLVFHLPTTGKGSMTFSVELTGNVWDAVRLWCMGVASVAKVQEEGCMIMYLTSARRKGISRASGERRAGDQDAA